MKKGIVIGIITATAIVLVFVLSWIFMFSGGELQAKYNTTTGVKVVNSERIMYEHSTTYVEGKAQELSKEKLELVNTKDSAARKAIIDTLRCDCANLDENDLNDQSLKTFLEQIRNGELK